jgi:hypothetical protein
MYHKPEVPFVLFRMDVWSENKLPQKRDGSIWDGQRDRKGDCKHAQLSGGGLPMK